MASSTLWETFGSIHPFQRPTFVERLSVAEYLTFFDDVQEKIAQRDFEWLIAHHAVINQIVRCVVFGRVLAVHHHAIEALTGLVKLLDHPYDETWLNLLNTAVEAGDNTMMELLPARIKDSVHECRRRKQRPSNGTPPPNGKHDDNPNKPTPDDPGDVVRRLLEEIPKAQKAAQEDYLRRLIQSLSNLLGNPSLKFPISEVESFLDVIADYPYSSLLAELHLQLAKAYFYHRRMDRAISTAKKSYLIFGAVRDHYGMCMASLLCADAYVMHRLWVNADRHMHYAHLHAKHIENRSLPGVAFTRGSILYHRKHFADSAKWYEMAPQQYEMHPEYQQNTRGKHARAACLQGMGLAHIFTDEYEKAQAEIEESHALYVELNLPYQIAHTMVQRGNLEFRRLNYTDAQYFMKKAQDLCEAIEDEHCREVLKEEIRRILYDTSMSGRKN